MTILMSNAAFVSFPTTNITFSTPLLQKQNDLHEGINLFTSITKQTLLTRSKEVSVDLYYFFNDTVIITSLSYYYTKVPSRTPMVLMYLH